MLAFALATLAGAAAAFVTGAVWYGALFGGAAAQLSSAYAGATMTGGEVAFEAARCLALAAALAVLIRWTGATGLGAALLLGLVAWAGFQAAGLAGAVAHEGYPLRLYLIHAGDALAKALLASLAIALVARWLA